MAKPRRIELDLGTVSLQGFPTEVADKLEEHILSFNKSAVPPKETLEHITQQIKAPTPEAPVEVVAKPTVNLDKRAIGLTVHENKYKVVTIAYNIDSKEASVITMQLTDGKRDGINKFKQTASELNFV